MSSEDPAPSDELLIRSLAALRESTTDGVTVEQHLEEFQARLRQLDTDPKEAARIAAIVAEVEREPR